MVTGSSVQVGDEVPGGGDHDRVEPSRAVRNPSMERILSHGGHITDMDTTVIKVEAECLWFAVAEGERYCRFCGVAEAVQLGEMQGTVLVLDVAEDTAGADRGE